MKPTHRKPGEEVSCLPQATWPREDGYRSYFLENHILFSGFLKFIYLFFYFWLCWVFVAACWLSLAAASMGYSSLWCTGFSLWWLLLLWSTGSRRAGFSSCGTWASVVVAHGL